ncbi:hypothetical protein IFM89_016056 [Coptis chinensis]|uniref:Uncharacterized protein n=1 Tax=Coptis chinensis TaxID=261450 RepID=A0A835HN41_9MAGN|nr:hypothetical protein IFM89_016056 [Coptis chinensis]
MSETSEASGFEANESEASGSEASETRTKPKDAERKRNGPKKVKKEEWEAFVDMCSTEEDKIKRCNGKLARENMKNPHTTGRMGEAPVIEQLKKDSPTGEEEINILVSVEPDIVERDLDNDPVAMVIGRDGRGRVCGLGGGVTKTVYHASTPYKEIAQREKRARESSESGYEAVMARLDEADKARKILKDEVADLKRQSSRLGNASQLGGSGWGFTKFSCIDYVRWKAENRIVPGVNAKLLGCQEP